MNQRIQDLIAKLKALVASLQARLKQSQPAIVNPINQEPPAPAPTSAIVHASKINDWAAAIQVQEGWNMTSRSYKNLNPGNLKYTTYTVSLGAQGHDANNFCTFPTYQAGFSALCQLLRDACNNKLAAFRGTMTLHSFTQTYAEPPDNGYCLRVAAQIKVDPLIQIKNLL